MKKILSFILVFVLSIGLVACGSSNDNADKTDGSENKKEDTQKNDQKSNEKIVDGVKFTLVNIEKGAVVGDRTKDNVSQENGEYFALGSKIVPVSDYEKISIQVKVENTTDKAISLSDLGWSAIMDDDFKLKNIEVPEKLKSQVPSNYSVEDKLNILVEKKMNIDTKKITLKYNLIDYTNMGKLISDTMSGIGEKEAKEKYPELFKENYAVLKLE